MVVNLRNAVKKAEENKEVKELKEKGYFLNSGISILRPDQDVISDWNLTYYNLQENMVVQVMVNGEDVRLKEPAKPLNPTKNELKLDEIKTNSSKMLEKVKKEFLKMDKPLSQVIMTVQDEGDFITWKINFITQTLEIVSFKVDTKTGNILGSETIPLTK